MPIGFMTRTADSAGVAVFWTIVGSCMPMICGNSTRSQIAIPIAGLHLQHKQGVMAADERICAQAFVTGRLVPVQQQGEWQEGHHCVCQRLKDIKNTHLAV